MNIHKFRLLSAAVAAVPIVLSVGVNVRAAEVESTAVIDWTTFSMVVGGGLTVDVTSGVDSIFVETPSGIFSDFDLAASGAGAISSGPFAIAEGTSDPTPLPPAPGVGTLTTSSSVASSGLFPSTIATTEIERILAITGLSGAGPVAFSVDYTLTNFVASTALPVFRPSAESRVAIGVADVLAPGITIITGPGASLRSFPTGFDVGESSTGTLVFGIALSAGESVSVGIQALAEARNGFAPIPIPAPIYLLTAGLVGLLAATRKAAKPLGSIGS